MILHLVSDLTTISSDLPSLIEIITPLLQALTIPSDAADALPGCLHELHAKCVETVASHLKRAVESRVPLRMQHQPAVAIKQYNPSFDDDFQPDVSMDPDRERAEKQKLMRKTKKEKKGAMRELKKDAAFIAREREAERSKTTAVPGGARQAGVAADGGAGALDEGDEEGAAEAEQEGGVRERARMCWSRV